MINNINKETSIIYGLSASKEIAKKVSEITGITLGEVETKQFADGEIFVDIKTSSRNKSAFIIQSTNCPANDKLMELLLVIDALKRSSVGEVNLIVPYFGYARQDRKVNGRQAISAKLVANMLTMAGADRIITLDIHADQIAGFFDIPFDNLKAYGMLAQGIDNLNIENPVVVSPDHGGVVRARSLAKLIDAPLAVIDKRRTAHNEAEAQFILGDVAGKAAVIFDDMVDTGGTVATAVNKLLEEGATEVYLAVSHAVLSSKDGVTAVQKLRDAGIKKIITTNSIARDADDLIEVIDISSALAGTITSHTNNESITDHFIKKYNTRL